jgi:hypothetical protein
MSQLIVYFPTNERRGEIDTLHHVLVPVNWNVAVDQAHTILQGMGSRMTHETSSRRDHTIY